MELQVNAPPAFDPPKPDDKAPAPPPPSAPGEASPSEWAKYWTPEQGARVIMWGRHTAARVLEDPTLEPDKITLELAGPPLAACFRAIPIDTALGKAGVPGGAKLAIAGLILILALAIGIPVILALRKRAARKRGESHTSQVTEAPPEDDAPEPGAWRARPRTVGTGILGA